MSHHAAEDPSIMTSAGVLVYVVLSVTDRFFARISDLIYIPAATIGIMLMIAGIARARRARE